MQQLNCLYVENNKVHQSRFGRWIKNAWAELNNGIQINLVTLDSPDQASEELKRDGSTYHLLIADIYFGENNDESLGIQLIEEARKGWSHLGIIALSVGDTEVERTAKNVGADDFLPKAYLTKNPTYDLLQKTILQVLSKHGYSPVYTEETILKFDKDNLALTALIESIGEEILTSLMIKLLDNHCKEITIYPVKAGLSGASVLRADCKLSVSDGRVPSTIKILLKVARDKWLLMNEHAKRTETNVFPGDLFVRFRERSPEQVESQGWYAIGADFETRAKSLLEMLTDEMVTVEAVEMVMSRLWGEGGLKDLYQNSIQRDERPNVALWNILSKPRLARIQSSAKELEELIERHDTLKIFDREVMETFIRSKRINSLDEESIPPGVHYCKGHGDLHSRNILVNQWNAPRLIDPANIGEYHWATDIARLSVDLIASGWDAGYASHEWENIDKWIEVSRAYICNEEIQMPDNEHNKGIYTALKWIREHFGEIYGDSSIAVTEWEFRLALGIEFLRVSYRQQDMATPKRVLGLIAACEALRQTSVAFSNE